jgi:hypothetical protein
MAQNWDAVVQSRGIAWGIPQQEMTDLKTLSAAAAAVLSRAQSAERNVIITAECNEAFNELKEKMRFIKTRYFASPPLTDPDYAGLGLKPKDVIRTPIGEPDTEVEADLGFPDFHLIELRNIRRRGSAGSDPRSEHRVQIYTGILDGTGKYRITEPPHTGDDLHFVATVQRKRERFDFNENSGKTVFFCLRWENPSGKAGPWGTLLKAVIP